MNKKYLKLPAFIMLMALFSISSVALSAALLDAYNNSDLFKCTYDNANWCVA